MTNYLSEHFTINEMTASETARKFRIDNTPPDSALKNLKILCSQVLEPARAKFGQPLTITSGYRCLKLNRLVGGQPNSYHTSFNSIKVRLRLKLSNQLRQTKYSFQFHKGAIKTS